MSITAGDTAGADQAELLSSQESDCLTAHYRLERRVEHALQAMQDKQTQSLPQALYQGRSWRCYLGSLDWQTLDAHLSEARREVDALFNDLIAEPNDSSTTDETCCSPIVAFAALSAEALDDIGVSSRPI